MAQYNNYDPELDELTPEDKALLYKQIMGGDKETAVSNPNIEQQYHPGTTPDVRQQMLDSTQELYKTDTDPYKDAIESAKPNLLQRIAGAFSSLGGGYKDVMDTQNAQQKTAIEAVDKKRQMLKDRILGLKDITAEQRMADQAERDKQLFPLTLQGKQQDLATAKAQEGRTAQLFPTELQNKQELLKKTLFENKMAQDPVKGMAVKQAAELHKMANGKELSSDDLIQLASMNPSELSAFNKNNQDILDNTAKMKMAEQKGANAGMQEFEKQTAKDDAEFVSSYKSNEKQAKEIYDEYNNLENAVKNELSDDPITTQPYILKKAREVSPGWKRVNTIVNRIGARNVKKLFPGQTSNFEVQTALAQVADPAATKQDLLKNIEFQKAQIAKDINMSADKYNQVATKRNLGTTEATPVQQTAQSGLPVGTEKNGYRFKGGNPNDKNNWEKI